MQSVRQHHTPFIPAFPAVSGGAGDENSTETANCSPTEAMLAETASPFHNAPMRWPLRNQILLPFLLIQGIALTTIAGLSAWVAVQHVETEIQSRLGQVVETLQKATFPLTSPILQQLKALSGADFAVFDENGGLRDTTLASAEAAAPALLSSLNTGQEEDMLDDQTLVELAGVRYFARPFLWNGPPQPQRVTVLFPEETYRIARQQAMWPPLLVGGGLLLVTITVSLLLSRRFNQRLHGLTTQVQTIAAGNFAPHPLPAVNDELRDVAAAVNQMARLLEQSLENARQTERSRLLTQLVGGLAHQLRNAITGGRLSVQVHKRRCPNRDDEALQVALQQMERIEEQIKGLLRIARGEDRTRVSAPLQDVVEATVALIAPVCEHQQIGFKTEIETVDLQLIDADGMRAALLNLLMNALEAAGPTGQVGMSVTSTPEQVRMEIRDNGPGFEDVEAAMRPFYSTKQEGIGLGLALATQGVADCGGQLTVERIEGETCFLITLPSAYNDSV